MPYSEHLCDYAIPLDRLKGQPLWAIRPDPDFSSTLGFLQSNGLLFGMNPDRIKTIEFNNRFRREDNHPYHSIDVVFMPVHLKGEKQLLPWINVGVNGDYVEVIGGPALLDPLEDVCFDDMHCNESMWGWQPAVPFHIRNTLSRLKSEHGINETTYPHIFESTDVSIALVRYDLREEFYATPRTPYLPGIPFEARYLLFPLKFLPSVSKAAEDMAASVIEDNGGSREEPKPEFTPRPPRQRTLVERIEGLFSGRKIKVIRA